MGHRWGMNVFCLLTLLIFSLFASSDSWTSGRCRPPSLPNGRVRLRSEGSIAKFNCRQGFYLWGAKYATCILGTWDSPPPTCIRPGCRPLMTLYRGKIMVSFQGALATLICEQGYYIKINGQSNPAKGYSSVYCDGRKWNVTSYYCVALPTSSTLSTSTSVATMASTEPNLASYETTPPQTIPTTVPPTTPEPSPPDVLSPSVPPSLPPPPPPTLPPLPPPLSTSPPPPPLQTSPPPPTTPSAPSSTPSTTVTPIQVSSVSPPSPTTLSTKNSTKAPASTALGPPFWCDFDGNDMSGAPYQFSSATFAWTRNSRGRLVKVDYSGPLCGWNVMPSADLIWSRKSDLTTGGVVGLSVNNGYAKKPQGIYVIAQGSGVQGGKTVLQSPAFNASYSGSNDSSACFTFWYRITNGALAVSLEVDGSYNVTWSQKAWVRAWSRGFVPLEPKSAPFKISLTASFIKGQAGSVSVDNLWLTSGQGCNVSVAGSSDWQTSVGNGTYQSLSTTAQPAPNSTTAAVSTSAKPPPPVLNITKATPTSSASTKRPYTFSLITPTKAEQVTKATNRSSPTSVPTKKPITKATVAPSKATSANTKKPIPTTSRRKPSSTESPKTKSIAYSSSTESDVVTVPGDEGMVHGSEAQEAADDSQTTVPAWVIWASSVSSVVVLLVLIGVAGTAICRRRMRLRERGDGDSEVRYLTSEEEQLDFTLQKVACEEI